MPEGVTAEIPKRNLMPIPAEYGKHACGIPSDSAAIFQIMSQGQAFIKGSFLPDRPKTLLKEVYSPLPILMGQDARDSRFVFNLNALIDDGGTAEIRPATDRLTGRRGIAKIVDLASLTERLTFQANEQIQLEGELMVALQEDPFLRKHVVEVWDIATVLIKGTEALIIFEERMEKENEPTIEDSRFFNKLNSLSFLNVADQLCQIIDKLAEYNVFHYDLSSKNIFINLETMNVKVGDFGTSNFALDINKYPVSAQICWASPERESFRKGDKDPGLVSEVFPLTALIYSFLINGDVPYDGTVWPSQRNIFMNKAGKFTTFFDPEKEASLKENCKFFSANQLERLIKVFEKGLAANPQERYQSGTELMTAIKNAIHPAGQIISFVRSYLE